MVGERAVTKPHTQDHNTSHSPKAGGAARDLFGWMGEFVRRVGVVQHHGGDYPVFALGRFGGRHGQLGHVYGMVDRAGEDHAFVEAHPLVSTASLEI